MILIFFNFITLADILHKNKYLNPIVRLQVYKPHNGMMFFTRISTVHIVFWSGIGKIYGHLASKETLNI